ncbi:Argininosuccinate synthase [Bienertia sinuspersici]
MKDVMPDDVDYDSLPRDMERLESTDKSETKARCLHCKAILTAKSKGGASHLKRHLDKCLAMNNVSI